LDFDNIGITDTATNISVLDPETKDLDVLNRNTLALSWEFGDVTGSDSSGNFYVTDFSSGSAQIRDSYGWVGSISGYQHSGYGYGFATSSTTAIKTDRINIFKFVDPERVISSDMVNIVDDQQLIHGTPEDVVSYHHALEKSMYSAVSDEMLSRLQHPHWGACKPL
jgi:glutamine cyclotransferase